MGKIPPPAPPSSPSARPALVAGCRPPSPSQTTSRRRVRKGKGGRPRHSVGSWVWVLAPRLEHLAQASPFVRARRTRRRRACCRVGCSSLPRLPEGSEGCQGTGSFSLRGGGPSSVASSAPAAPAPSVVPGSASERDGAALEVVSHPLCRPARFEARTTKP